MTIALALITMGAAHLIAFTASPLGHLGAYIRIGGLIDILRGKKPVSDLLNVFIDIFLGVLEILGDIVKVISLATRLFGNILAGEVLLMVISALVPYIIPIPFFGMELFVGFIQALVFAMLTLVFISMATTPHGDH
jgi:F-type H+-transporting ATPase subunit a